MDSEGKNKIIYFFVEDELNESELEMEFEEKEPKLIQEYLFIAKKLVKGNEWKWIKVCGNYLYMAGDKDMKKLLNRYSLGQFTKSELELNIYSEFSKEDMQDFALKVLEQS